MDARREGLMHHVAHWDEVTVFLVCLVLLQVGAVYLGWLAREHWELAQGRWWFRWKKGD